MSEQQATFIKVLSFIGGFFGAAICVCLGLKTVETDIVMTVLLLLLAAVFLLLIYPLYQIGKLGDALTEQSKKIRVLAKKQAKQKKEENSVSQYSPLNKHAEPAESAVMPRAEEKTVLFPTASDRVSGANTSDELTREFSMTKQLNMHTGELIAVPGAAPSADSLEIYRSFRSTPHIVPKMMALTLAAGGLHTVAVRYD